MYYVLDAWSPSLQQKKMAQHVSLNLHGTNKLVRRRCSKPGAEAC